MATTRSRPNAKDAKTTNAKKALKDTTNGEVKTATKLPRKIPSAGPSTANAAEPTVAGNTRSSRKKPVANVGRTRAALVVDDETEQPTEPTRLEERFERAAREDTGKKKRKALDVIEIQDDEPPAAQKRVTRARTRKSDVEPRQTPVVNLTCDERLVAERGFVLASTKEVGAAEDVYPFSKQGGRRINELRHALSPYVENGHLFSAVMRQDLVDWVSCQHGMLELADETFHLALRFLDTFLLRRGPENFLARNGAGSEPVPALPLGALPPQNALYINEAHTQPLCNKLKRLGITCVFVAAKVVEVCAPPAGEFSNAAEVSTFSRSQLLLAERALLRELEYDLYHPTSSSFASAYLSAACDDIKKNGSAKRFVRSWNEDVNLGAMGSVLKDKTSEYSAETDDEKTMRVQQTSEIVDYVLEAVTVARDGMGYAPSLMAASAIGWTMSRNFACEWEKLPSLHLVSGYSSEQVEEVYGFLDKVVRDFKQADRRNKGGFFAHEKHPLAVHLVWTGRGAGEVRRGK